MIFSPFKHASRRWCLLLFVSALLLFGNSFKSQAQLNPVQQIDSQLRALFAPIWRPIPGPNHLFEMSCHMVDSSFWAYQCNDTLITDTWYQLYKELRSGAYDTTLMDDVSVPFLAARQVGSDTVIMNILAYDMLKFIDSALTSPDYFDFDTINMTIADVVPRELDPYIYSKVFAASPHVYDIRFSNITYRIDPTFIFHDSYNDFQANNWRIEIDFGDGMGWQNIPLGTVHEHTVTYFTNGEKILTTRVLDGGNNVIMYSKSAVKVTKPIVMAKGEPLPPIDGINAMMFPPCNEDGEAWKKTIIYVEGMDIEENRSAGEIFARQINTNGLSDLLNFGYTIVVVDWKDSKRDIKENGLDLANFLDYLKCNNQQDTVNHNQFVIVAESMGGLCARWAMCLMENYPNYDPNWCQPEKMHNTRLFISLDVPHAGANIPIMYQYLAQSISHNAIFTVAMPQAWSIGNMLTTLHRPATKQMLLYHIDNYNGGNWQPHPFKDQFFHDLDSLGNYPRYTKMVALSNGSMTGRRQTRYFDGAERQPNDVLAYMNTQNTVWILGIPRPLLNFTFDLHTTPNGNGTLGTAAFVSYNYRLVINFRWKRCGWICWYPSFSISFRQVASFSPVFGVQGLNMKPYDIMPGSTLSSIGSSGLAPSLAMGIFGNNRPTYLGSGAWHFNGRLGLGNFFGGHSSTTFKSDGMEFNFIPTFSSLDYPIGADYYKNIVAENITTKTNATPFDVIAGITEDYPYRLEREQDEELIFLYNRDHLHIRNDTLGSWINGNRTYGWGHYVRYPVCNTGSANYSRFLNREIGDDSLLVENREIAWEANYDCWNYIGINERSAYYEYPSSLTSRTIPGIYSKEDDYLISTGPTHFLTTDNISKINYNNPPSSSLYTKDLYTWSRCCKSPYDYRFQAKPGDDTPLPPISEIEKLTEKAAMSVYPNPIGSNSFTIEFAAVKDKNSSVALYDLSGKKVMEQGFEVASGNVAYRKLVQVQGDITAGTYFVVVKNGGNFYHKTIIAIKQ